MIRWLRNKWELSACLVACLTWLGMGHDACAQSVHYEDLITTLAGRQALVKTQDLTDEQRMAFQAFWANSLAMQQKGEKALVGTEDSYWRVRGLMTNDAGSALLELYEAYIAGVAVASERFMGSDVDSLFEKSELDVETRLNAYAAMLPLLQKHALDSADSVYFKKLQATADSLMSHGFVQDQSIRCTYVVDEGSALWIQFPFVSWASNEGIVPEYGVFTSVESSSESTLYCELVPPQGGNAASHSPHLLKLAIDALLQSLVSKDQDAIDASGNALLLSMNHARDDRGWAMRINPAWDDESPEALKCMLFAIQLVLIQQDRLVLAARLDDAMKRLFAGTNFYSRLASADKCEKHLPNSYRSSMRSALSEQETAYKWVVEHFSDKQRGKVDSAFSKWTRKQKPEVTKFRRQIASFVALSLGDYARAGKFYAGITDKLNRANNPQVYGYDLAMVFARGESPNDHEISARLDALASKSPTHMFDSLSLAMRHVPSAEKRRLVEAARQFSPSLAPQSAALFASEVPGLITAGLSGSAKTRLEIWALQLAWYAWLTNERDAFGRQIVQACQQNGDMECVRHVAGLFLADPLLTAHARAYWESLDR